MSEEYVYSGFTACAAADNTVPFSEIKTKGKAKSRILRISLYVLVSVCLLEGLLYLFILFWGKDMEVQFSGLHVLEETDLHRDLSLYCGSSWFGFDTGTASACIASRSAVEHVSVEKHFPNTVSIRVSERIPVALVFAEIDGKTRPFHIDKNGILFAAGEVPAVSVPLLSGMELRSVSEGLRIDGRYRILLEQIAAIRQNNADYFSAISEIKIRMKEYGNYELEVYPLHIRAKVLTDGDLSESALQYMLLTLDVIHGLVPDLRELDLRRGSVSYRVDS